MQNISYSSAMSANDLSFYVRIDKLVSNFRQIGQNTYWSPSPVLTGFTSEGSNLFRWRGGRMTAVAANDPVHQSVLYTYSIATIFTQNPDTPHLLIVPFDARTTHAFQNPGGWRPLCFHHRRIGNTQYAYSSLSANGDRQHIAAPGSAHWMPQLLPSVYDYQTGSPRLQAGLIGSLPLLIALAAFSAPPTALVGVLTNCLQPGRWYPHQFQYPAGRESGASIILIS